MKSPRTLRELFSVPGFSASMFLEGVFGDRYAWVVTFKRRKKQPCVPTVAIAAAAATTSALSGCVTSRRPVFASTLISSAARALSGVHVEHLDWLAKNPRYTQCFALQVGKLCRDMPNKAVAELERLHDSTVKELDKLYMQQQVVKAGMPAPRAIGIDEISMRKGHKRTTTTESSSATWSEAAPFGLAARGVRRLTSIASSRIWGRKSVAASNRP